MILLTGSSREAILSVIAFFIIGGALLVRVDVARGRQVAREAESALVAALSHIAEPSRQFGVAIFWRAFPRRVHTRAIRLAAS